MPHIVVKLWPGRSEEEKIALTGRMAEAMKEIMDIPDKSISVAFEEVAQDKWMEEVYQPEIMAKKEFLYKKPGY